MKASNAVLAGRMKLALADIDQAKLRLDQAAQELGTNVVLDQLLADLTKTANGLNRFADRLRG